MKATVTIRAKTQEDLDYIKAECKGTVWNEQTEANGALSVTGVADTEHIGIEPKAKSQVIITFGE